MGANNRLPNNLRANIRAWKTLAAPPRGDGN